MKKREEEKTEKKEKNSKEESELEKEIEESEEEEIDLENLSEFVQPQTSTQNASPSLEEIQGEQAIPIRSLTNRH